MDSLKSTQSILSMLTDDCIFWARDRAHSAVCALGKNAEIHWNEKNYDFKEVLSGRGAVYHNVTVLAMGFAHAADALSAIETLVFQKGKYSVQNLLEAARSNYTGNIQNEQIYAELMHCEKYATGYERADQYAAFVLNALADACEKNYIGNIRFLPTCHTIDSMCNLEAAYMQGWMDGMMEKRLGKKCGSCDVGY